MHADVRTIYVFCPQKRDDEKETLDKLLKDKNPEKIESIVYQVLKQRHFEETVQLAAQYEREKELTISEKISAVTSTRQEAKETLLAEQRKDMMEVVSNVMSLSNADLSKKKLELKKQHKKQLTEFDKATQESIDKTTNKPNPEKELQYNSQVLALRERQIKELAQVISVYSPEQALVKSYEIEAERAAVEAERFRKDIIESRVKKFAVLKEERRQKEEARKKEREAKLRELEAEIEHEKTRDVQRQEQLSERYQVMQEQRIAQQEAIHKRALDGNAGISEQERQVRTNTYI
ncbi:uncharacterized protein LOC135333353 [Halichondria panicea]|uniref:uncharacterized protein LOC135333353 n=1 Tax=Halichondria panicea TaxID=6063 RepID=UPI00312B93B5